MNDITSNTNLTFSCSIFWCNHQLFHPRAHVRLLWPGSTGTSDAKVPMVEEIPHHYSDGAYNLMAVFLQSCSVDLGADVKGLVKY